MGRNLQAMGSLAHKQLLALTIGVQSGTTLEHNLFKKTKDICLIYAKKLNI